MPHLNKREIHTVEKWTIFFASVISFFVEMTKVLLYFMVAFMCFQIYKGNVGINWHFVLFNPKTACILPEDLQ